MRAPDFWWRSSSWQAFLLAPFGWLYGLISGARMNTTGQKADRPVLCIGNFVLGGAGKTPTAHVLYRTLKDQGLQPVFLLRGYGGAEKGPLLVNRSLHDAAMVGDEALLLAQTGPTIIARDRVKGADYATACGADIIIMDDGFQNPSLKKDLSLVVIDAIQGVGNGHIFPAGPLRVPLSTQIQHADAALIVGNAPLSEPITTALDAAGIPRYRAEIVPRNDRLSKDQPYLVYAGIGRPDKVFETARALGLTVRKTVSFPDHHHFTVEDARKLLEQADAEQLALLTTAKDHARLAKPKHPSLTQLYETSDVLGIEMRFAKEEAPLALLASIITAAKARKG